MNSHNIISRYEAKRLGYKFYFTGKPCKNGGIGLRRVDNTNCCCDYCKAKKYNRERALVERNKGDTAKYMEEWRERNREKISRTQRRYRDNASEKLKKRCIEYYYANRDKYRIEKAKRRAKTALCVPAWFSEFDEFALSEARVLASLRTIETGISWHVDHMVPLQSRTACGLHCAGNIQVIPAAMNLEKRNKMLLTNPLEWLRNGK